MSAKESDTNMTKNNAFIMGQHGHGENWATSRFLRKINIYMEAF